jgi:Protein of unknown function (DUF2975)
MGESGSTAQIRQRSARLRGLMTFLLIALSATLVLERFSRVTIELFAEGFSGEPLRRLAFQIVAACPEVFYLLALWWVRQALAAFADGRLYTPTITRMLNRVGIMLAAGSFISTFLLPSAARALGFGPGYLIAYDVSGLVLGAVGLSLTVIAHVLQHAGHLQAELDEIF